MHSLSPRQPNTQNGVTDSGQNGTEPGPEHQRLISLSHRGLVQYYDFTHDPSSRLPVLLMEQMTESLTRFLERLKEPPPLHVQLDFAHDISLALAYLHQNSIIHGNLTSNNVLLSSDGHVKVSDYGLRSLLPITQAHSMGPCTIPFLPPEAFTVPPVYTDKLDSFSWGVVALQIMTCLFPNPSPTAQFVTDPRFPSKPIEVFVSEIGRRKSHIDRVGYTNPLLPVAVLCFENPGEKRPQMAEICQNVSLLKTSDDYRLSQEKTGIDWSARQITALSASRGNEEAVGHDYEEVDSSEQDGKLAAPAWQGSEEEVERLKQLSLSEGKRKGEGRGGGEMVEKGEGMGQAEGGGEGGGGGGGGGVGEGEGGGGGGGEGEGGKPREVEGGEGEEEQPIEPSAPPLQNGGLPPAASAPTTQPMLPPYTQASPWQHLPPPQQQLPPPYSETPPQYFQGPPQFQHHQPTPFPPQQNSGPPVGVGVQASTRQVQCDVCKRQMKYTLSPAKRVTVVKCSNCKEVTVSRSCCQTAILQTAILPFLHTASFLLQHLQCTLSTCMSTTLFPCFQVSFCHSVILYHSLQPVAPPPEGKVYDRCRFCNNCNVHPITAKRVVCPRQTWSVGVMRGRSLAISVLGIALCQYLGRNVVECVWGIWALHCGLCGCSGAGYPNSQRTASLV